MAPSADTTQQSSPSKYHTQGHGHHGGTVANADERRKGLVQEMSGQHVGAAPIAELIDLLPAVGKDAPKLNLKKVPKGAGKEHAMYGPLVST